MNRVNAKNKISQIKNFNERIRFSIFSLFKISQALKAYKSGKQKQLWPPKHQTDIQ
jgi:hypothetical protein